MKIFVLILCLQIFWIFNGMTQAPSIAWENSLGGNGHEDAQCVIETQNKRIFMTGHTHSWEQQVTGYKGVGDVWVVCLDEHGGFLWQKCYGGSMFDEAKTMIETSDGHIVIAGFSESSDQDLTVNKGIRDAWILKIDTLGNLIWQTSLGGSGLETIYSIVEKQTGGYVAVGFSEYADGDVSGNYGYFDAWVIHLDDQGNKIWEKSYGGSGEEMAHSVKQTQDGGFIIAGKSSSSDSLVSQNKGYMDAWIFKIDSVGNLMWEKSYGGGQNDLFFTITHLHNGTFVASGESSSMDGDISHHYGFQDVWTVCIDSLGNILWEKTFGGGGIDIVYASFTNQYGNVVMGGMTSSTDGNITNMHGFYDLWMLEVDSSGNLIWQSCYGDYSLDLAYSVAPTLDGSYIAGGQTLHSSTSLTGNHGAEDIWVLKLNPAGVSVPFLSENKPKIAVFPNPASDYLIVKNTSNKPIPYEITDLQGRMIQKSNIMGSIDISSLQAGLYVFKTAEGYSKFQVLR
jgi:hypothetical protein